MGDWGIKISKDGFDVSSATVDELAFTSLYNIFKMKEAQTGTWSIANGSNFGTKTITLTGYTTPPIYAIFVEVNNKNYYIENGGFIEEVDGTNNLFLYTRLTEGNPPVLSIIADPNANPAFAAARDIDYYLYLGIDDI